MTDHAGEPGDQAVVERALRVELADLDARIAAIPSDRFAERSPLLKRRDALAAQLRAAVAADPDTLARWARRAGSKETGDGSTPFVESRIEPGGT